MYTGYESYPVSLLQPFPMMSGFVIANETISGTYVIQKVM